MSKRRPPDLVPHLARYHHKDPNLKRAMIVVYNTAPTLLYNLYHGCSGPVSGVIQHIQVLSLQVAYDRGHEYDWDPDHQQGVVGWSHDGDLWKVEKEGT